MNPVEETLYSLIKDHPQQRRQALLLDPRLCEAARNHALDMVTRSYFGHTSPEGVGPNERVKRSGYPLPKWYHQHLDANNIESYYYGSGNWNSPEAAFSWFMNSPLHRSQILADSSFTAAQTVVGIGHAINPRTGVGGYVFLSSHAFHLETKSQAPTIDLRFLSTKLKATARNLNPNELYNLQISRDGRFSWETIDAFVAEEKVRPITLDSETKRALFFVRLVSPLR